MSKLTFLLIFYNLLSLIMGEYDPPKSVEFPFGDEVYNTDLNEGRVQEEPREINVEIIKLSERGRKPEDETILRDLPVRVVNPGSGGWSWLQKHYNTKTASYSWWPTLYITCGRGAATLRRHSRFGGGFNQLISTMSSSFGTDYNDKLSFLAEWFDYESAYQKRLLLNYYPCDSTVELYDIELKRIFLKRSFYESLHKKDVFVGNTIRIYGRQLKITDYADCRTKQIIGNSRQHTFAVIKPSVIDKIGEIINQIQDRHFEIIKVRMCRLNQADCLELYDHLRGSTFLPFVVDHVTSGPIVALELVGDNAIERWKQNVGPTDPIEARRSAPDTLRAIYGQEKASNAFHAADDCDAVKKKLQIFFPDDAARKPPETTLKLTNSTCCVVKPHAISEGKLGYIISFITEAKFKITAMQTFYLSNANAEEFLEVYKGVVSDFHALLLSFLDGPCIALEISGETDDIEDVHGEFRKFVGPSDSEVARQIRPNSLRARFGIDKYRNAVHCTDLKEDTELELEYFFKILS